MNKLNKKYGDMLRQVRYGSEFDKWIDAVKTEEVNHDDYKSIIIEQVINIISKYPQAKFVYFNPQGVLVPIDSSDFYNRDIPLISVLAIRTPEFGISNRKI